MAPQSVHQSLDPSRQEIRLIEISPFDPSDQSAVIECGLHVVSLLDKPEYVALSYVWGDPAVTAEILVNGRSFQATVNLAAALRQALTYAPAELQHDDKEAEAGVGSDDDAASNEAHGVSASSLAPGAWTLRFWADAICINQEDTDEKNHQIPLLKSVYSGARLVVASLGHGDEELELGLQTLEQICIAFEREVRPRLSRVSPIPGLPLVSKDARKAGFEWLQSLPWLLACEDGRFSAGSARCWQALENLARRPYFRRVWIIQEMTLATKLSLVSDGRSFSLPKHAWAILNLLVGPCGGSPTFVRPDFLPPPVWAYITRRMHQMVVVLASPYTHARVRLDSRKWSLHRLGLQKLSTDKRDHVYGILGLSGLPIQVDYNKSAGEVYADMAVACFQDHALARLDEILTYAGVGLVDRDPDAPPWAPCPIDGGRQGYIEHSGISDASAGAFKAGGRLAPQPRVHGIKCVSHSLTLSIRGYQVEKVALQRPIPDYLCNGLEDEECLQFLEHMLRRGPVAEIQGPSPSEVMLRTLFPRLETRSDGAARTASASSVIVAWLLDRVLRGAEHPVKVGWGKWWRWECKSDRHEKILDRLVDDLGETARFSSRRSSGFVKDAMASGPSNLIVLRNQCLFETSAGKLGRGPVGTRPEDVVCVLRDVRLPALLRRVKDGHHVLVGLCHIPGLMDGMVVKELIARGAVKEEEFVLK
ncbi:hypothetical protein MAPG_09357 [Magnaporthiopsis poae ATCC 64411]|uniref:Heterokaryon incompatibility domain-containing protein n=1 Tax=Magnaporthiopsis poae (strain ATCC 64411 / 73-15) TaxID=644358 RepID=A0A0C4E9Q9_MAGP6|nr:hypothetical protein MAPG_09357 [Magnaporthiopsis poae ATCC 64411]